MEKQFVTKKYLDKRMGDQARVIVSAVDQILERRLKTIDTRFDIIESKLQEHDVRFDIFEGKLKEHDKRFDILEAKLDNIRKSIDGYVKAQEDFKQEFIIMKEEVKQIKKVLKQKLGVEIRAV